MRKEAMPISEIPTALGMKLKMFTTVMMDVMAIDCGKESSMEILRKHPFQPRAITSHPKIVRRITEKRTFQLIRH